MWGEWLFSSLSVLATNMSDGGRERVAASSWEEVLRAGGGPIILRPDMCRLEGVGKVPPMGIMMLVLAFKGTVGVGANQLSASCRPGRAGRVLPSP